ncbi:hypothetical protein PGTUg99_033407 [Puccinia graminis f. sp. tritici]|uniref:Uncharacterized protein n=1 Tax=Puccinia graminis f. sp. tritici TaxID=56615 RepID=A0A5B0SG85_PUCGR|nr:hypothetical protein PGTUg99_033407 [Puccinia graminis f. sp. tritici]
MRGFAGWCWSVTTKEGVSAISKWPSTETLAKTPTYLFDILFPKNLLLVHLKPLFAGKRSQRAEAVTFGQGCFLADFWPATTKKGASAILKGFSEYALPKMYHPSHPS